MRQPSALLAGLALALAPSSWAQTQVQFTQPFEGVRHEHVLTTVGGRKQSVQAVIIDLAAPGVSFKLTPQNGAAPQMTNEQTTLAYLVQQGAQIAVNTHFFTLDSLPTADLVGLAASNGEAYSPWAAGGLSAGINIGQDNSATLVAPDVAGGFSVVPNVSLYNAFGVTMTNGANPRIVTAGIRSTNTSSFDTTPNPRTAVALLPGNRILFLTVDGRHTGIADGMTLPDLADFLIERYEAIDAVNLDGGGSTTLSMDAAGARVMNAPVGVGSGQAAINTERANGANLAIFATRRYGLLPDRTQIAYEGFAYENRAWGTDQSTRPNGGGVNCLWGGLGWNGHWRDTASRWSGIANYGPGGNGISGVANDPRTTPLNYTDGAGNALATSGGQLRGSFGTSSSASRQLDLSLVDPAQLRSGRIGADGTTLWISFLAQSFANTGTTSGTQRFAYVQLGSALRLGKLENSPTGNWGAQDASTGGQTQFSGVASGGESMILAKVVFQAGAESVSVWVNPPSIVDESLLGAPSISMPVADFTFADVAIVNRYSTDFDELRLGWNFASVLPLVTPCAADIDGNGIVGAPDLVALISAWGTTQASADLDANGVVGGEDLGILLVNWGACR
jgi:hypothetical protein